MVRLGRGGGYSEDPLPRGWGEALEFDWMKATREALMRIMPETSMETAAKFLGRARFTFFLSRALEAIKKGGLADQRGLVEGLLEGRGDQDMGFDDAVRKSLSGIMKREELNTDVLRVKVAYALREAQRYLTACC